MLLKDLNSGEALNNQNLLLVSVSQAAAKNGKPYLKVVFRDSSEEISGNLWDSTSENFEFKVGQIVSITGGISEYQGKKQLNISKMLKTSGDVTKFGRNTDFDVETLWNWLIEEVNNFSEPMTKFIAEELLLKQPVMVEQIKLAPAATKVHNNWYGGLLEHIWSLCQIAKPIVAHYKKNYAPNLSQDKVLFGLMIHDLGKIVEYDTSSPAFPMTNIGCLTNHMVLGPAWVYEKANIYSRSFWKDGKSPDENTIEKFKIERAHLMHILAAHHGQVEWGSPMKPATLEAILVHHCDNLDSKMLHAIDLIKEGEGQIKGFSERSYFERTGFLRGSI